MESEKIGRASMNFFFSPDPDRISSGDLVSIHKSVYERESFARDLIEHCDVNNRCGLVLKCGLTSHRRRFYSVFFGITKKIIELYEEELELIQKHV